MRARRVRAWGLALVALGLVVAPAVAAPKPTPTVLETLGGRVSQAEGINAAGQIVGYSFIDPRKPTSHAVLWDGAQVIDLGTLGGDNSAAMAINNKGEVVGVSGMRLPGAFPNRAFVWRTGTMHDLGALTPTSASWANAINEQSQIVGWSVGEDFSTHAVLWEDGQITQLPELAPGISEAEDINNRGQIVGHSSTPAGRVFQHAVLWENGQITDLGTQTTDNSYARGINNAGQVVGYVATIENTGSRAVMWQGGRMTYLPELAPGESRAEAINNRGQITGWATAANGQRHAMLWANGQVIDLGTVEGGFQSAGLDLNARGDVVGWTFIGPGVGRPNRAVLWSN